MSCFLATPAPSPRFSVLSSCSVRWRPTRGPRALTVGAIAVAVAIHLLPGSPDAASSQAEYLCCLQPRGPEPRNLHCDQLNLTPLQCQQIVGEVDAEGVGSPHAQPSPSNGSRHRSPDQAEYLCCTQPNNPRNKNLNCATRGLTPLGCRQIIDETEAAARAPGTGQGHGAAQGAPR